MTNEKMLLNEEQLTDFQYWKKANGSKFSLWDYLFGVSNLETAIVFTKLFWPDFVEYDNGIFLKESFSLKIYEEWKIQLKNDIVAIEKVMNHKHLDNMLPGYETVSDNNSLYLGKIMAEMWGSRLHAVYPNHSFKVECGQDEETIVLTFSQITNPTKV